MSWALDALAPEQELLKFPASTPVLLVTRSQPRGERVYLWCRAGISAADFSSARELLTAASLRAAKYVTDWHTPLPTQAALARFIDDWHLARHIRKMRTIYRRRHDIITQATTGPLSRRLTLLPSQRDCTSAPLPQPHPSPK